MAQNSVFLFVLYKKEIFAIKSYWTIRCSSIKLRTYRRILAKSGLVRSLGLGRSIVIDILDPSGPAGKDNDPVCQKHRLINTMCDEKDCFFAFFPIF